MAWRGGRQPPVAGPISVESELQPSPYIQSSAHELELCIRVLDLPTLVDPVIFCGFLT